MAVLEKEIQDKIDKLSNQSYELYEKGNKKGSYDLMEKAWELYPEPRENWNESYNTVRYAIDDLLKDAEIESALKWHERMTKIQENLGLWDGNYELYSGKIYYEKGNFELALDYFKKAFDISKGREFEGEDPKYKDFYLNPEKYIK